ncbi:MAG: hypothetical protein PWP45_958 [Tepidanaerobacteraceae bacterium]|nr:hypothetical protein [Tepidanaerobacteraceae bacterium]
MDKKEPSSDVAISFIGLLCQGKNDFDSIEPFCQDKFFKFEGYSPIFAYLGREGYVVNVKLREGRQHCQKDAPEFINESIQYARAVIDKPLIVKMDAGNDSIENINKSRLHNKAQSSEGKPRRMASDSPHQR